MFRLNDFHAAVAERARTAFHPEHDLMERSSAMNDHTATIHGMHVRFELVNGEITVIAVRDEHGAAIPMADISSITAEIEATLREETRDMEAQP